MGLSTIIPSIIFGLVGLFIIVFTLRMLLSAVIGNPLQWFEEQKFRKKERLLSEGDSYFQKDEFDKAVSTWKMAFYLDRLNYLPNLTDKIQNHNINVLGKLLSLSEKQGTHIINLAVVEELMASRTELLHLYFETFFTLKKLRMKKKGAPGKTSPDWALQEFSKKHSEIKSKIDANRSSLELELKKLFDSLGEVSSSQGITYH